MISVVSRKWGVLLGLCLSFQPLFAHSPAHAVMGPGLCQPSVVTTFQSTDGDYPCFLPLSFCAVGLTLAATIPNNLTFPTTNVVPLKDPFTVETNFQDFDRFGVVSNVEQIRAAERAMMALSAKKQLRPDSHLNVSRFKVSFLRSIESNPENNVPASLVFYSRNQSLPEDSTELGCQILVGNQVHTTFEFDLIDGVFPSPAKHTRKLLHSLRKVYFGKPSFSREDFAQDPRNITPRTQAPARLRVGFWLNSLTEVQLKGLNHSGIRVTDLIDKDHVLAFKEIEVRIFGRSRNRSVPQLLPDDPYKLFSVIREVQPHRKAGHLIHHDAYFLRGHAAPFLLAAQISFTSVVIDTRNRKVADFIGNPLFEPLQSELPVAVSVSSR